MGALLPDSKKIREATASTDLHDILDSIEGNFLEWKKIEQKLRASLFHGHENVIDISSATSMNLNVGSNFTTTELEMICSKIHSYPYIIPKEHSLEDSFLKFIKNSIDVTVSVDEVLVFNGTYAATRTIVSALPGQIVLVPEFMNQLQKLSIASLGKKVVDVPMCAPGWTLDLQALQNLVQIHKDSISCMYIHHALSAEIDTKYLAQINNILSDANIIPIIDIDILKTKHTNLFEPAQIMLYSPLRFRGIFLFTLSKECNAPGLRVGFGIAKSELVKKIKLFQQQSLEMISPVTKEATKIMLEKYDLNLVVSILQSRMNTLVNGLRSLGLEAVLPHAGINLFMHVPRAWEHTTYVLPDHLFTYYCLTRAGVVLRPGSMYGHRLNHFVRFVVCQSEISIKEVIQRFQNAGIHGQMVLPSDLEDEYQNKINACKLRNS